MSLLSSLHYSLTLKKCFITSQQKGTYFPCPCHSSALSIIYRWPPLPEQSRAKPCITIGTNEKTAVTFWEAPLIAKLLLKGDQSAYRDLLKGSCIHLFHLISDSYRALATLRTAVLSPASYHSCLTECSDMQGAPGEAPVHLLGMQVCWAQVLQTALLRSVFCSFQRGSLAGGKDGEILPPTAQHPSARGGGHDRSEPIPPLTTPQQGHSHEDPEKGSPLHLVRPQAARGGPA